MTITSGDLRLWKDDLITKSVYEKLAEVKFKIEDQILNLDVLRSNSQLVLAKLSGMREGIDLILNLSIEEVEDYEEN